MEGVREKERKRRKQAGRKKGGSRKEKLVGRRKEAS